MQGGSVVNTLDWAFVATAHSNSNNEVFMLAETTVDADDYQTVTA